MIRSEGANRRCREEFRMLASVRKSWKNEPAGSGVKNQKTPLLDVDRYSP
jgi:hypothetical protein